MAFSERLRKNIMDDQDKRICEILGKDCEHNSQNTLKCNFSKSTGSEPIKKKVMQKILQLVHLSGQEGLE